MPRSNDFYIYVIYHITFTHKKQYISAQFQIGKQKSLPRRGKAFQFYR
jgi:hypothetical protein